MTKTTSIINVFKNGTDKISKSDFTKKWSELVNQMEKNNK